jgi:hypothetical protein
MAPPELAARQEGGGKAANAVAPEARVIIEAALRDEMATTKWNIMGRRRKDRETHFLLRATGMGWRRSRRIRRAIRGGAKRLREDGKPTEREIQLAVDLILQH